MMPTHRAEGGGFFSASKTVCPPGRVSVLSDVGARTAEDAADGCFSGLFVLRN